MHPSRLSATGISSDHPCSPHPGRVNVPGRFVVAYGERSAGVEDLLAWP
jgi:hypothetical protein